MLTKEELIYIKETLVKNIILTDERSELLLEHINNLLDVMNFKDDLNVRSIELHKQSDEINKKINTMFSIEVKSNE